jgi:hypothetical protein
VLPYPWPKRRFTPTVCALLRQVAAVWPADGPTPHLVADRGFPSCALFQTLHQLGWGWTIRLRARDHVTVGGTRQPVRPLLDAAQPGRFRTWSLAAFGSGRQATTATVVVGRGLLVVPRWQRGPGSLRRRAEQRRARTEQVRRKHPGRQDDSAETDGWLTLFTTRATWRQAVTTYRRRWATEGTYRDAQGGWDGQHGWGLERLIAQLTDPGRVERLVGLWALGALAQTWVGVQVHESTDPTARAITAQWTVTGRLSVWAHGRFAFTDPSGRLRPWLAATLQAGADRLAAAPPLPTTVPWRFPCGVPPRQRAA